jgi:hypothetical protein
MAGSLKWFVYTTDAGADFGLYRDESNVEAGNAGTQDYPNSGVSLNALPRNITPRKAVYQSTDGKQRREVVCLTQAIYAGISAGVPSFSEGAVTFVLKLLKGERRRVPFGQDTGLDDGDAT